MSLKQLGWGPDRPFWPLAYFLGGMPTALRPTQRLQRSALMFRSSQTECRKTLLLSRIGLYAFRRPSAEARGLISKSLKRQALGRHKPLGSQASLQLFQPQQSSRVETLMKSPERMWSAWRVQHSNLAWPEPASGRGRNSQQQKPSRTITKWWGRTDEASPRRGNPGLAGGASRGPNSFTPLGGATPFCSFQSGCALRRQFDAGDLGLEV